VDAVHVDSGGEKIGIAGEAHSGEIATVAAAPKTDALSIDVGARLQIFASGDDVLIFAGTAAGAIGSFTEGAAVADSAAIVDGENDVAAIGEIPDSSRKNSRSSTCNASRGASGAWSRRE